MKKDSPDSLIAANQKVYIEVTSEESKEKRNHQLSPVNPLRIQETQTDATLPYGLSKFPSNMINERDSTSGALRL